MSSQSGNRRTSARGGRPSARSGPGRAQRGTSRDVSSRMTSTRTSARSTPARVSAGVAASRPVAAARPGAPRTRFTGRAAILVIVLAVLAVSYASSLRAYLQQRSHIESQQSTIVERQAEIQAGEREKAQWQDPEYIKTQARARLGMVLPGETPFVALRDGQPLEPESSLTDPSTLDTELPPAWWDEAWDSVLVAGDPRVRTDPPPLTRVDEPVADGSDDTPAG